MSSLLLLYTISSLRVLKLFRSFALFFDPVTKDCRIELIKLFMFLAQFISIMTPSVFNDNKISLLMSLIEGVITWDMVECIISTILSVKTDVKPQRVSGWILNLLIIMFSTIPLIIEQRESTMDTESLRVIINISLLIPIASLTNMLTSKGPMNLIVLFAFSSLFILSLIIPYFGKARRVWFTGVLYLIAWALFVWYSVADISMIVQRKPLDKYLDLWVTYPAVSMLQIILTSYLSD